MGDLVNLDATVAALIEHWEIALSFAALGLGGILKHWTPLPNDAIPYVNAGLGFVAGLVLVGVTPIDGLLIMGGGGTMLHQMLANAQERRSGRGS